MQRTLVVLAAFVMMSTQGGTSPGPVRAGSDAEPSAALDAAVAPLQRLLIVIRDPDDGLATPDPADLATRLHLADPTATVIVLPPGPATRTVGSFWIVTEPAAGPEAAITLRVETAMGPSVSMDLPAPPTRDGRVTVVEVLGGPDGIAAWRIGDLAPSLVELRLPAWRLPAPGADAVALDGAWWTLVPAAAVPATTDSALALRQLRARLARTPVSRLQRVVDASVGDVTGDGVADLALSFRRPFRRTLLNASRARRVWMDPDGLSAHVGLFRPGDLSSMWVAGTLLRPVHRLAACTGALAVTYSTLRRPKVVAATAWAWQGFGFLPLPELPGTGRPTCIDIDRDTRPDAAIVERS